MKPTRMKARFEDKHPVLLSALLSGSGTAYAAYKIPLGHPAWVGLLTLFFCWLLFFGVGAFAFGPLSRFVDRLFKIERY